MNRPLRTLRAGFTLIELLAVMLIIGILATFLVPQIPAAMERANITACKSNMKAIAEGLNAYHAQFKGLPKEGGARFHTALVYNEIWESTEANARRLTCPAVSTDTLLGISDLPAEEWYVDKDAIDGSFTSYAGRDMREHPIRKYPISGKEVLVGDDNDGGENHKNVTVVLMGDYSTKEFNKKELQAQGLMSKEEELLPVGPTSPVEALQMLSLD